MTLAAAPDGHETVARPLRGGGVRLDVALMDGAGAEFALDYDVRAREAVLDVAEPKLEPVGEVGLAVCVSPAAGAPRGAVHRQQALVQDWRAVRQRVFGAQDGG